MPKVQQPTKTQLKHIDALVAHFESKAELLGTFKNQVLLGIQESSNLMQNVHSIKSRLKDPAHLKDKLIRKLNEAKRDQVKFDITKDNLFWKINDLVGVRILHLHTDQISKIDRELKVVISEYQYKCIEGPMARTWDIEYKEYFENLEFGIRESPNMYTSVHYVLASNTASSFTCEVQVRTLAEELWGEVDHAINYPHKSESLSCREQIKALARATSTCTRLVDSIFRSNDDHHKGS